MEDANEALVGAILAGDVARLTDALAAGADPNHAVRGDPRHVYHDDVPVLALAAWAGAPEVVSRLLDAGAHINTTCTDYRCYPFSDDDVAFDEKTALAVAARRGHLPVVELLLARGARPDLQHPLTFAAEEGHPAVVRALLEAGASPNQGDGDFHSPLYYACRAGRLDIIEALRAAGGHFSRRVDLDGARTRSKAPAVLEWLAAQPERALLGAQFTWWRVHLERREDLDAAYAEVVSQLTGEARAWGEVLSEAATEDHPFGADWSDLHQTVERALGSGVGVRVETTRATRGAPRPPAPGRVVLRVQGLPAMSWEDDVVLLGARGAAAELDAVDRALGAATLSFEVTHLPDADSEYAARRALRIG